MLMVSGGGATELIVMKVENSMISLKEEARELVRSLLLLCELTMRRELSKARKQAFTRHWTCQPLDLRFQPPEP